MQLPSISASASFLNRADDWCGTKVPGVPPQPGPDPFAKVAGLLEKIGLNPQPLPPASKFLDEFCGTVPRGPFPPVPPHVGGLIR